MTENEHIPDLPEIIRKQLRAEYRFSNTSGVRASSLSFPCMRKLWFDITVDSLLKPLPNDDTLARFNEGNYQENHTVQLLGRAGVVVTQSQRPLSYPQHRITGHIDGTIEVPVGSKTLVFPYEHKAFGAWTYRRVETEEDFMNGPGWMQQYPGQMQLYLLMVGEQEQGIFLMKNRDSGQYKQIVITLDYEYAEGLLQKADRLNDYVDRNQAPPKITYKKGICGWCDWREHPCGQSPELPVSGNVIKDTRVDELISAWLDAKKGKSAYDELDKELKPMLPSKPGMYETPMGYEVRVSKTKKGAIIRRVLEPRDEEAS